MKKQLSLSLIILCVLGLIGLAVVFWLVGTYNEFVTLRTSADSGWAQVETQYQRRADLIPQLVATVEGAAGFEKSLLVEVTEARTNWLNTQSSSTATREDQISASNSFDSALSRLLVTMEAYPAVTATENFVALQSQLEGTENRIAVARKDYNDLVRLYNTAIQLIPGRFVAGMFGFIAYPYFESAEGTEVAPIVEFEF
ncbi:LemA family protein [Candidatus Uhrbacteria bacterium CG10_big_fil_rev_8_21_14_0_10_48_16]|uniref:LemA family protein n=1 Tax=Candidatus Uhrbacteria bacterium CG10_big_fil_rev_8_21_14_0_10_48_16 TaxID=1975038 RepID=A0A2M8LGI8_9BACT|nr:MAG: LemA family protein [Candidatus Uhrbacteria bacterium CG10_big_fil_rev_8_21_14_0_10_48_16]